MLARMGKEDSFAKGVLFMLLSATGLAFVGFLGKISLNTLSLPALIFWRYFSGLLLCFTLLWIFKRLKHGLRIKNLKMHLLRAFFVFGAQYSFYYYIEKNTLLNGVVLLNTGPMFIPLIERLVLRTRVGASSWISTFASFVGVILVLQPDRGIFSPISGIGLLAGLCQGASQVVFGINSRVERSESQVLYLLLLCASFSFFTYLFSGSIEDDRLIHGWIDLLIFFLAVATITNLMARAAAYQHGTPSRLAPFLYFSVLIAGILDWAVFGQIPNLLSLIGAGLVITGGILKIYLRTKFKKA